ncbi:hypothetical protein BN140_1612 [Methanoculleus bourgensis MS2]|mgnify:CR=1 FL=1|jgi:hypothetical protein|uniref:Uncharacterized protein n=1 Tax=Methanoculleus bourgensis (strain ATCC 43281 / DSM 3045 / OCM 15 / MS2) TaxID=1201294 RepID=I7KZY9_METBM|nr:hypothetical protein [Methanoculleus bourgensis]CCJ36535.1 hypothetical protein BN140_1612 [Methanoculleus bourgensis MS2]
MDRTLSEKFWGENLFGISYLTARTFLLALLSAAVGMLFVGLGARGMAIPSDYWWIPLLRAHPLHYISIGIGFVFLASSLYLVRSCFKEIP